jgi:hypothetical protein
MKDKVHFGAKDLVSPLDHALARAEAAEALADRLADL